MFVLGISSFYHDSAAVLICDGEIIAAAQEERFTRKKNDESFPINAIRYCLQCGGIALDDLKAVVFYEKPFIKFERILETHYEEAPFSLLSFLKAMPVWLKEKLFLKRKIKEYLGSIEKYDKSKLNILFAEHHLSHAASSFFPSSFNEAAIVTVDAVGEWATCTISHGQDNHVKILKQLNFPHSIGLLYSAFTYFCGFKVNSDEYKLMGLAAYGNENDEEYKKIRNIIETKLIRIATDGSLFLHPEYFTYTRSLKMVNDNKWHKLFNVKKREPNSPISQSYCNMALAIQHVTEQVMLLLAKEAKRLTGSENLCLAGGVALNCLANGKILKSGIFKKIFIQPASNDAGGALGAALAVYHIHYDNKRKERKEDGSDLMKGSLLGPEYSDAEVVKASRKFAVKSEEMKEDAFYSRIVELLKKGKAIAWFQGRMEFGPRALGSRSILGDPRIAELQSQINLKIKFRESFRPFAPIIIEEEVTNYFDIQSLSPYMLLAANLKTEYQLPYPDDAEKWNMAEKFGFKRSFVPAVTHIDYTARLQTVDKTTNKRLYTLLKTFFLNTGCPMLINTSFNSNNEPIVNSPEDAFQCFMNTNIDYLAINNFVFEKEAK